MSHTRVFSSLFLPFESRRSTLIALGRRCYVLASIFLVERRQLPSMSSGFTLFVGTSRDFSSPANSAAVNALGFRRRSSKSHFIHGTTASVHPCLRPYIPISLLSAASSSYCLLPSTSFSISTSPHFMSLLTVFCVSPRFFSSFRSCFFPLLVPFSYVFVSFFFSLSLVSREMSRQSPPTRLTVSSVFSNFIKANLKARSSFVCTSCDCSIRAVGSR